MNCSKPPPRNCSLYSGNSLPARQHFKVRPAIFEKRRNARRHSYASEQRAAAAGQAECTQRAITWPLRRTHARQPISFPTIGQAGEGPPYGVVMATTYLRFADLKARNIVTNWHTLAVWIKTQGSLQASSLAETPGHGVKMKSSRACQASQVGTRGLTAKGDHVVGWIDDGVDQSSQSV